MKTLSIAFYHVLVNFRDRKETLIQIGAPILLIFILGNALGNMESNQSVKMKMGLTFETQTELSVGIQEYLKAVGETENITVEVYDSFEELEELVETEVLDSGIVIDSNLEITVIHTSGNAIEGSVTTLMLEKYDQYITSEKIKVDRGIDELQPNQQAVSKNAIDFEGDPISAIDYYAITMLAMFMMYGAGYGAYAVTKGYYEIRGQRIRTSNVNFTQHFFGLALGTSTTITLQGTIVVLFSKYVFGANFGENLGFVLLTVVMFAILATGLGMFVSIILKDKNKGVNIINVLIPVFTLLSGGFGNMLGNEGIVGLTQKAIPNYQFQEVLMNYAYNTSDEIVMTSFISLLIMIVVCYGGALVMKGRTI